MLKNNLEDWAIAYKEYFQSNINNVFCNLSKKNKHKWFELLNKVTDLLLLEDDSYTPEEIFKTVMSYSRSTGLSIDDLLLIDNIKPIVKYANNFWRKIVICNFIK